MFLTKYIIFLSGTLVFSFLINHIFLRFIKSLGIRNASEAIIRWSDNARPSIGGLTFYIVFLLTISVYSFAFNGKEAVFNLREIGILMAVSLGFLMGLGDDAYDTKPLLKSGTQVACGLILVFTGTHIQLFESDIVNIILTLVWVIGIMNSINMLDNMDGITGSVSLIISITMLTCLAMTGSFDTFYFILISGIICSLLAFLFFNWHPSKMFMGDSGSQFLGVLLASLGITIFWNLEPVAVGMEKSLVKVLIPVLAFIVPIADTTTVVINRIARGKSPFVGGKDHTTHNLARLGLSDSQVALCVLGISIISGFLIIFNYRDTNNLNTGISISMICFIVLVFFMLYMATQIKKQSRPQSS